MREFSAIQLWVFLPCHLLLRSLVMYGEEEMPIRQSIVRGVPQGVLIGAIALALLYIVVPMRSFGATVTVAVSVPIVYAIVWIADIWNCWERRDNRDGKARQVAAVPRLSWENPRMDTGRYDPPKLSALLPKVQAGEID